MISYSLQKGFRGYHLRSPSLFFMYYVYKLWIEGFDEAYIGCTDNPRRREQTHKTFVYSLIMPYHFKTVNRTRRSTLYATLAGQIMCRYPQDKSLMGKINFKVIHEVVDFFEAGRLERSEIEKLGPEAINPHKKSHYMPQNKNK